MHCILSNKGFYSQWRLNYCFSLDKMLSMHESVIPRVQPLGLSGIPFFSEQLLNQPGLPKLHRLLHITGPPECVPPADPLHGGKQNENHL